MSRRPVARLRCALVMLLFAAATLLSPTPVLSHAVAAAEPGPAVDAPIVESAHPYANSIDVSWTIELPGARATRIHFSRIELEDPADYLVIGDPANRRVQVITGAYPAGLWTDPVPGEFVKIRLVTDGTVRKWGFAVDQKQAADDQSITRSAHPYLNNTNESWTVVNPAAGSATRVHFSRLDLEENVDWLILSDVQGQVYQYLTGAHPDGLWSAGIPGGAVRMRLVTDSSVERWGFNVDNVESTTPAAPEPAPAPPTVVESNHPYPKNTAQEWTIVNPDLTALSTKVHFSRLQFGDGDWVSLYDANDTLVQQWGHEVSRSDIWSEDVPGRIIKVRLTSCCSFEGWGFRIDRVASGEPLTVWAQSNHPYGNNLLQEWTIVNPDPAAVSTKVHMSRLQMSDGDFVRLYDGNDVLVQQWGHEVALSNVWSDYIPGRIVKVRMKTCCSWNGWGFQIDRIASGENIRVWAQSDHPYANDITREWTIINPNGEAKSTRVHFSYLQMGRGDFVRLYDANDTLVQQWGHEMALSDTWSNDIAGRIVKVRLTTCCGGEAWGFRIDDIFPATTEPLTPASITGVYVNVAHAGRIYLNGAHVATAEEPGEYKILLPGLGEHLIRIEYDGSGLVQTIQATVSKDNGLRVVYLPLTPK